MDSKIYEDLLCFVWQYRKIPISLQTITGEQVKIINPGIKNNDSGPDFFGAKIQIGETTWAGNIEIHIKSSDWQKHKHHKNSAYDSVILHVVYEYDKPTVDNIIEDIPTIELKQFINKELIDKYKDLINSISWIPCEKNLNDVEQITIKPWLSRIMVERLEKKTDIIKEILAQNKMDWETSFFYWFSSCFGFKLNNEAFLMLAKSIPFKTIMWHQNNLFQIEALLFGQAGLLRKNFKDEYPKKLKKEYDFLAEKYKLTPLDPKIWKFMRTRPGNFPTIRISQLANILTKIKILLFEMINSSNYNKLKILLKTESSEYWKSHYNFEKKSDNIKQKKLGSLGVDNLIINAIVPFIFLYGKFHDKEKIQNSAISILENIKPEENHIIKKWGNLGIKADNSLESQALIELFNSYCTNKKCLSCSIGASLLIEL